MRIFLKGRVKGMAKSKTNGQFDVVLGEVPSESVGYLIAQNLAVKGFCVLNPGFEPDVLRRAVEDARDLDFYAVNAAVLQGLLGPEGSSRVADIEAPSTDEDTKRDGDTLRGMDHTLTRIGYILEPYFEQLELDLTHRSSAVVHLAGDAEDETPPLNEVAVSKWQSQFLRHRLMVVIFLGPKDGTLEMQPYDTDNADPHQVKTQPGTAVVLRADTMSHRFAGAGEVLSISCFFMTEMIRKRAPQGGYQLIPAARTIEAWTFQRLKDLKVMELEGEPNWDPAIPEGWRRAMNHSYRKGQISGVAGVGLHFPCTYNADDWFRSTAAGVDYATEVPMSRWDHDQHFDANPECWQYGKTYCRHGNFAEGIELFDNKFFNLSPNESRGLDPHQRCLMEQGYNALHMMGYAKKNLMNAAVGTYIGCGTDEWFFHPTRGSMGGIMGSLCMFSGRFAFCLGMKGPAISITTEAASGLACLKLAAESVQKKGLAVSNESAVAIGVHFMIAPMWWKDHSMQGWLSYTGRCLTFNSSTDGYVRGDGCCALGLRGATQVVDGKVVENTKDKFLGIVSGAMQNQNGKVASMMTPHGPGIQECIVDCIRNAGISPLDMDSVEAHGDGHFIADAIEAGAIWRAHRSETHNDPLVLLAAKSSMGNQIECSGMTGFLRIVYAAQWGYITPNIHNKQINPHIEVFEQALMLATENMNTPYRSSYAGVGNRGFGGTNVFVVGWGTLDSEKVAPPPPREPMQVLYWPGGGGELEADQLPRRPNAYSIVGTWSRWEEAHKMQPDGDGAYTYTVTLGENRWEQFQIWLDGDPSRVLHPGGPRMSEFSTVLGPDEVKGGVDIAKSGQAPTWMIDGREAPGSYSKDALAYKGLSQEVATGPSTVDLVEGDGYGGQPGDQYRVLLRISGRWRMLTWEKVTSISIETLPTWSTGTYFVTGSWNRWEPEQMKADPSTPGHYLLEVRMTQDIGDFQILRDRDWCQVFFPNPYSGSGDSEEILGPDTVVDGGQTWCIDGKAGDRFTIQFQRVVEHDRDTRKVSWQKTGHDALTITERWMAEHRRF
uniref:Type I polyketide synthase n=1 Tax=Gambierdiscus polynesiensis TaxID=439318 RepID=A0A1S6K7X4_9DINO|nr:type I polyketide synthase [Gambierdiscus polynesiensis]